MLFTPWAILKQIWEQFSVIPLFWCFLFDFRRCFHWTWYFKINQRDYTFLFCLSYGQSQVNFILRMCKLLYFVLFFDHLKILSCFLMVLIILYLFRFFSRIFYSLQSLIVPRCWQINFFFYFKNIIHELFLHLIHVFFHIFLYGKFKLFALENKGFYCSL